MNSTSGDSESAESNSSVQGENKNIIDRILGEMKSQFNKTEETRTDDEYPNEVLTGTVQDTPSSGGSSLVSAPNEVPPIIKTEDVSTNGEEDEAQDSPTDETSNDKPRLVLLFKKPNTEIPAKTKPDNGSNANSKRSLRGKQSNDDKIDESVLKRSARRRSKDCNESVLQSAIARKEKSYNESNKPQRLSRQLKPTQKILENLAIAKQEKIKPEKNKPKPKNYESEISAEVDTIKEESNDKVHRKHKHKHHKHNKKAKRFKSNNHDESSKDSESDQEQNQSIVEENPNGAVGNPTIEEIASRRSRRISSARLKDDSPVDSEQDSYKNDSAGYLNDVGISSVGAELIKSRLCLCTKKTQFYLETKEEETLFCNAVDNVGSKLVGCSRLVDIKDPMMLRPSTRIPYTVLCETHKNRLLRHNCCPTCGVFCTQGQFVQCEAKHQYHRHCQISVGTTESCPHCGVASPDFDVTITMKSSKRPVLLPVQKQKCFSAKMNFPLHYKSQDARSMTPPLIPIGALTIPNHTGDCDEEYQIGDLIEAINANQLETVAIILGSKSIDLTSRILECNEGTVLHLAAQKGFVSIVHILLVSGLQADIFNKDQNTALMVAVIANKNDAVQFLIKAGANIELKGIDGMTALHLASKCGNLKACELILKAASGLKNFVNVCDDGGWTPLVWACEHGYADIANFLIYKGADPSVRDVEHNVALHWAAFSGSSHIAELLLNRECDVNAVNAHGDTPLHIGARQDMYNCILVLLARGADVTVINKNSESPLDCVPSGGDCYNPISLNITLQASDFGCPNVILSNDISKGRETNPIQCYNNVDDDQTPTDYQYITKYCITSDDVKLDTKISSLQSCTCEERCVDDDCTCGNLSFKCWYDKDGKLISGFNYNDIPMIFECNDRCACNVITCNNRVVQKGLSQRFELFKTLDKGWGIRSLRLVPKGSFVCEYVGEVISDVEADRRDDDSFVFDLENRVCKSADDDAYCIDAKYYGNLARFINHSCSPNLVPVKVFVEHQDLKCPRIAFFANRDIRIDEELGFDYGEKFWFAKYKSMSCFCGSSECKYSEEIINSTMQNYQRGLDGNGLWV